MSDIEGSEPDWPSCEGSSERVWATSEFQLARAALDVFDDSATMCFSSRFNASTM